MDPLILFSIVHFRNSNVKFVGTIVTGAVEPLRDILKNGVTNTECAVLVFQTQRTSMKLHLFRYDC